jgi:hypothetical protein
LRKTEEDGIMNETDDLYGKKVYVVHASVKNANIIFDNLDAEIVKYYPHEYGCGAIKIIHEASTVKAEVWDGDSDLGDCPWWLLTFADFMAHCKEIIEEELE